MRPALKPLLSLFVFGAIACSGDEQPTLSDDTALHYAVVRSDDRGDVIDACSFSRADFIVLAEVVAEPTRVSSCQNDMLADMGSHFLVPLSVLNEVAGDSTDFSLAIMSSIGAGIPKIGEKVLVSVIDDDDDHLALTLIYVSLDSADIEGRDSDGSVDLPGTLGPLRQVLSESHAEETSHCTADQLSRRLTQADLVQIYRDVDPESCTAGVRPDDGLPD